MNTPVLNNGIFLKESVVEANSYVEDNHLRHLLADAKPTDMGVIELWAQTKKIEMPLYSMASFGGKNEVPVYDVDGRYSWRHPVAEELPFVMEDMDPSNLNKGRDGAPFKMKLSKRGFGHGDIITYDKMRGIELYITGVDIISTATYAIYTVTIVNSSSTRVFDNKFLKNGTSFFRVGSAKSSFGQKYSDMRTEARMKEFYNYVGNSSAHVSYSVSSKAALMAKGGITQEGKVPMVELWKVKDKELDPSINSIEQVANRMGKDYMKNGVKNGNIVRAYLTKLEAAHISKIATDIENYLMWGKGGRISAEENSPEEIRLSMGLWGQTDNSFKHVFNREDFTLDMFKAELFNYYNGRVDFTGPDSKNNLEIQTGLGGAALLSAAIEKKAFASGMELDAKLIGAVDGAPMDLGIGFAFTSFKIPYLANIKFKINPALDPVEANDIENPMIDGFRLSSYSYLIIDVTDGPQENIKLLRKQFNKDFQWSYINGNMDYMGRTAGFQRSGDFDGYKVNMEQAFPAIWLKDPTKIIKFVMRNPITGGSF